MAGPAADVTRERPSAALELAAEAVCLAASAAFVVVLVDSKRTILRPIERPDRLMTKANDIFGSGFLGERKGMGESFAELISRSRMRISAGGAEEEEDGAPAEEQLRMGGRVGAWVRRRNDIAQLGQDGAGDREKLEGSEDFERRWPAHCQLLGKKAANQRA
jgi:hypothetical protein